jgi:hypothetical protein
MIAPYSAISPGAMAARSMMNQSVPLNMVQMANTTNPAAAAGVIQAGGIAGPAASSGIVQVGGGCPPEGCGQSSLAPPGVPFGPGVPGMMAGAVAAPGALPYGVNTRGPGATSRSSVRFVSPGGMRVSWVVPDPTAKGTMGTNQLDVPGRYNFVQGSIYRLKLDKMPARPDLVLYPTLEVVPANCKTEAFLAHSSVPVNFTEEDFEQVVAGNYLVKVIYLPDPQYQDLAATGPDEVVSSRLEPGLDPIVEAQRRGSILLIIRMGNIDLEAKHTPAMDAPPNCPPKPMMLPPGATGSYGAGSPGMLPAVQGPLMAPPNMAAPQAQPARTAPPAPGSPLGMRSERPVIQQASYQQYTPVTPASLASQLPTR